MRQQYQPDSLKDEIFYRAEGGEFEKTVAEVRRRKGMPDDTRTDPPQGIPHP